MWAVLPRGDDPLVKKLLQLDTGPNSRSFGVLSVSFDAGSHVAGDVLREQCPDGVEAAFDGTLLPRRPFVGRLEADAHGPTRGAERLRQVSRLFAI